MFIEIEYQRNSVGVAPLGLLGSGKIHLFYKHVTSMGLENL